MSHNLEEVSLLENTNGKEVTLTFDNHITDAALEKVLSDILRQEPRPESLELDLFDQKKLSRVSVANLVNFIQHPHCPRHLAISLQNCNADAPKRKKGQSSPKKLLDIDSVQQLCSALKQADKTHTLILDLRENSLDAKIAKEIDTACEPYDGRLIVDYDDDGILHIPKNAEFFVALCKVGEHSFLTLGVVLSDGKAYNLANVGFKCWGVKAHGLYSEHLDGEFNFTYKAFTITREEYLSFVREVDQEIQNRNWFKAYVPTQEGGNEFRRQFVSNSVGFKPVSQHRFSLFNTCRQVAQKTAAKYFHIQDWGRGVYRKYFLRLPHELVMKCEDDDRHRFIYRSDRTPVIFPMPPKKNEINYKQRKNIMRRLESLSLDDSERAKEKFVALKALYVTLSPSKTAPRTRDQVLQDIQSWLGDHRNLMTKHRNKLPFHIFSPKSEKLVQSLEKEFGIQQPRSAPSPAIEI